MIMTERGYFYWSDSACGSSSFRAVVVKAAELIYIIYNFIHETKYTISDNIKTT